MGQELEYLKVANSPLLWIACIPAVALVMVQAFMFARRAWKTGPQMGVSKEQMMRGAKSAAVASIGPSVVIVIGAVSLLASVGGPLAWMRLAYIGSVMYELPAADRAATAAGSTLGTNNMTMEAFANCAWIMCVCCLGWIIVSALFTDKMGKLRDKVAGGSEAALSVIAVAGGMGAFGYQCFNRMLPGTNSIDFSSDQFWALIGGFVIMLCLSLYGQKKKTKWISQFGMTIAMIGGMLIGAITLI